MKGAHYLRKLCKSPSAVMPVQAGIQSSADLPGGFKSWIPASAGMTGFCIASLMTFLLLLLSGLAPARADELLIVRSTQNFEEAMSTLQAAIAEHGYKVTKVQRVDVGLEAKGYKTDRYRVVFYGKPGEVEMLTAKYPKLIPYLPYSIAIFAEEGNTILNTARPSLLKQFYPEPELKPIFERWDKDLVEIMDAVREAK